MNDRTIGAIALGPSLNLQGWYKFVNLSTCQIINQREFTELPMSDIVIKRVEELVTADREDGNIIFTSRTSAEIAANITGVDLQLEQD
eukprot:212060-Ditylum_brightwellii.AAC.2